MLVTLDDAHRDRLDAVARRLAAAGLDVLEQFELGGVIAGDVAPEDLAGLGRVAGVAHVERDRPLAAD